MKQNHNCISIVPRPTDWIKGVNSPIEFKAVSAGNWATWLPDMDLQKINGYESDACVPFSAAQSIATQLNYFMKTGQLPQPHLDFLKNNNYIGVDGLVHLSERFLAKTDGTNPATGTSLPAPWDAARKGGVLGFQDWPFDQTITNDAEFYATIPQALLDKAKTFLQYFSIQYHWIVDNGNATGTPISILKKALWQAPICIGVNVCGAQWNQQNPNACSDLSPEHSVMIYNVDTATQVLDHYQPFLKNLPFTWNIGYALQGIVSIVPQPPSPPPAPPIISQPITPAQVEQAQSWLSVVAQWLKNLLSK